jgi:hypothetical protein
VIAASTKTGGNFLHTERFGDVVIPAGADSCNPVRDRVACGEEEHTQCWVEASQPSQYLEAVHVGQPDVEYDSMRKELLGSPDGLRSGEARAGLPSLQGEQAG